MGMTDEPLTFEITYTKPFVAELLRRYRRSGRIPWLVPALRVVLPLVFCGLIAWLIYLHRLHPTRNNLSRDLYPLVGGLAVFILSPWIQRWQMYSRVRKTPLGHAPIRLEMTLQGVATHTAVGDAQLTWAAFPKARQFDDGFMLFQGPRAAYWLPLRCMVSGQPTEVEELLRAHVADFRRA